jgi:hypothetical protein
MAVKPLPGFDPVTEFNKVFETAYARIPIKPITKTAKGNNTLGTIEPHFVRELISDATIDHLNTTSATVYGTSGDQVIFRGGFLHHDPVARYWVPDNLDPQRHATRELADALVVLYETRPGPKGHQVSRRAAFMLMFKTSKAKSPGTPRASTAISKTSDAEQFYLYKQWPTFTLAANGSNRFFGRFDLQPVSGWCVGKYAVVWKDAMRRRSKWDYPDSATTTMPVSWLYKDPNHHQRMNASNDSFGHLLTRFVAGGQNVGRDFAPAPPDWFGTNGWDQLMGQLLGYERPLPLLPMTGILENESWGGAIRDANPASMFFMRYSGRELEWWLEDHADAVNKHPKLRAMELHSPWEGMEAWRRPFAEEACAPPPSKRDGNPGQSGLPVLFVYVNSMDADDEARPAEDVRG